MSLPIARFEVGVPGEDPFINAVLNSGENTPGDRGRQIHFMDATWQDGVTEVAFLTDRYSLPYAFSTRPEPDSHSRRARNSINIDGLTFMQENPIFDAVHSNVIPSAEQKKRVNNLIRAGGFLVVRHGELVKVVAAIEQIECPQTLAA